MFRSTLCRVSGLVSLISHWERGGKFCMSAESWNIYQYVLAIFLYHSHCFKMFARNQWNPWIARAMIIGEKLRRQGWEKVLFLIDNSTFRRIWDSLELLSRLWAFMIWFLYTVKMRKMSQFRPLSTYEWCMISNRRNAILKKIVFTSVHIEKKEWKLSM